MAERKRRGGGRSARQAERQKPKSQTVPYIKRNIPVYNLLNEEGLSLIENNADTILQEIGIDFRGDPEALEILEDAGAQFLANSCGICAGYGDDRLAEDEVCLSSTARNFKGRMGAPGSQVYLASPYTVAASAVTGTMRDPREIMEG